MKALLVYPPISKLERYSSTIGKAGGCQLPLGVYYLASFIRDKGHTVEVVDAEANRLTAGAVVERVGELDPDIVGLSSTTVAYHRAVEVAREIKRSYPRMPIVIGGPHVSSNVEHAMSEECFDFGVLHEGEITFLALLENLGSAAAYPGIAGLVFRRGEELVMNQTRPYITDLDALPFPAYDLINDLSLYTPPPSNYQRVPVMTVCTARGCPNRCTFCDQNIFGRKLRQRSAANIADEIELLYRTYGVREIQFVDDTFTLRPQRIHELFSILDRRGIHFPWMCNSRVDTADPDLLRLMKRHGCWHISFGIESGSEEILRLIKKRISLTRARELIACCRGLGIKTKGYFMVGHPGETLETIEQTIRFALELPLNDVIVTLNTPIPGTEQYAEAGRFGRLDTTDWSEFNYWRPVFVPHGLDEEILIAKHREFYRRFYLRPRVIIEYLLGFLSRSGPRRFMSLVGTLPFLFKSTGPAACHE